MSAPFHVYIAWDGTTPLYVGQTCDLARRFKEHAMYSDWPRQMTHASVIPCATRREAEEVEQDRIMTLRPMVNIQWNPRRIPVVQAIARHEWFEEFDRLNGFERAAS